MSNTIYNKITANNEVLIDLSTDTVTSAEHIVAGHVGHLADGRVVTGTGSGGTVTVEDEANATGVTCVITTGARPEPSVTWETVFDGQATLMGTEEEPYFWLPSSDDIYPVEGEKWRITFQGVEYISIAAYESRVSQVCIGNPAVRDSAYDGSGCPIYLFNAGFGALMGGAAPQYGLGTYQLKLEREVSTEVST